MRAQAWRWLGEPALPTLLAGLLPQLMTAMLRPQPVVPSAVP